MDQVLSPSFVPFTFALGLMLAILALEGAALLMGLSLHGNETDLDLSADMADLQASFDLAPDADVDVASLLEASHALEAAPDAGTDAHAGGILAGLGLGKAPLMIWLAAVLFSFGLGGYLLQTLVMTFGLSPLLPRVAVPVALVGALVFARGFAGRFAQLIPSLETTATSAQFMGGLRGVVTQGTARQGSAAEVRLRDRHGNLHYMRCEPFRDADVIPEGTDVLTLRERQGPNRWGLRIIAIS